jgi:homoserine O-acetyltransferase/O-succinyltransferase
MRIALRCAAVRTAAHARHYKSERPNDLARFRASKLSAVLPYAHKMKLHTNQTCTALKVRFVALIALLFLAHAAPARAQEPPNPKAPASERHEFVIPNFKTESGVKLPQARIVYGTYGHLNAAKDNVVLMPSHYMADYHGYEWLIGEKLALDPNKLFLVTTEMFGSGHSSSPSNTPEPFHGPRFPVTTIRDNVEAVHHLLVDELKVAHLRAIIGFSMGAEQAFQWAVSYPTFADRIVATAGTAKCYPQGFIRLESQINAIALDPAFNNGDYTKQPTKGVEAFALIWTAWLYSQEWWRDELWREGAKPGTTFESTLNEYKTNFIPGGDANDIILQMRTWERHDVGTTPGFDGDVKRLCVRSRCRFFTCRPKPIFISPSGTPGTNLVSFPMSR